MARMMGIVRVRHEGMGTGMGRDKDNDVGDDELRMPALDTSQGRRQQVEPGMTASTWTEANSDGEDGRDGGEWPGRW